MNYSDESGAKKRTKIEQRQNDISVVKKQINYLLYYLTVIFVLSLLSFWFDYFLIGPSHYRFNFGDYSVYYMLYGWMILPLALIYNYFVNHILPEKKWVRISSASISFLFFGLVASRNYHFGFYIGEYRILKNVMVVFLSGIFVELIRIMVVNIRNKRRMNSAEI